MKPWKEITIHTEEQKATISHTPEQDSVMLTTSETDRSSSFSTYLTYEEARYLASQLVAFCDEFETNEGN